MAWSKDKDEISFEERRGKTVRSAEQGQGKYEEEVLLQPLRGAK